MALDISGYGESKKVLRIIRDGASKNVQVVCE